MNEQRKVIYARRNDILTGENLRDETINCFAAAIDEALTTHCPTELPEEWDIEGLVTALTTLWPHELEISDLNSFKDINELYEFSMEQALVFYYKREIEITPEILRLVE